MKKTQRNHVRQADIRFLLTHLMSGYNVDGVARFKDIVLGITQQTSRKCEEMSKELGELNQLRDAYQRYRELSAQMEAKERSLKIGFALLFNTPTKDNPNNWYASPEELEEKYQDAGVVVGTDDLNLSKFPLWQVIREIVKQVPEVRVYELEAHLREFGMNASRPAIESALATHPKEFKITKRGREKFVSLKGA